MQRFGDLYKNLTRLGLKPSIFDNPNAGNLLKIKLTHKNIYLKEKDMHASFETECILLKLKVH